MRVKLTAGAEIDVLSADEARKEFDGLKKHLTKLAALSRDNIVRTPSESGVVAADGTLTLDLGSPDLRRRWNVRRVNVAGIDIDTAEAGRATIYRNTVDTARYVDTTENIPAVSPWSADQFPLKSGETLIVRFTGATAGNTLTASAVAIDSADAGSLIID